MGENDIQMIVTLLGARINDVHDTVKASRDERRIQIAALSDEIHSCQKHHSEIVDRWGERITSLETTLNTDTGVNSSSYFDFKNKRFGGLAAVVVAACIGIAIILWAVLKADNHTPAKNNHEVNRGLSSNTVK